MSTAVVGFLCDKASLIREGDERKICANRLHFICWRLVTNTARTFVFEGGLYADINMSQHSALDSIKIEGFLKCFSSNWTCTLMSSALFWYLKQPLGCPETTVRNHQSTLN
jgi:hypothetical protein